ncbi:MAG TPA: hypothetical protein VHL05_12395 [Terriglobales bacterium]|jgi:hypothetical protein|nr:hypothetical protein [Terriglobales bacterium]
MSTAMIHSASTQRLAEESKGDLIRKVMNMRASAARHKETVKKAGQSLFNNVTAAAGGAAAGILAAKFPLVPKTNVPSDLALGAGIALLCALDVFDGADPYINSFSNGLIGAGVKDIVQKALSESK